MTRSPLIAALAASAMTLAACATAHGGGHAPPAVAAKATNPTLDTKPRTDLDRYRAATRESDGVLALAQHPSGHLSEAQKAALISLAEANSDPASSGFVIRTASGETTFGDAALTARAAMEVLKGAGVAESRIQLDHYEADGAGAPIKITYRRVDAVGPDCRKGWDDLSATGSNRVYSHFGCATAANLAAMIANPRDLQHPATDSPADATRRGVILGKYRKGEQTSSNKDTQASGAVSSAVQ